MSTAATTEAKKRGRPKKLAAEDAGPIAPENKTTGARSASTKTSASKEKAVKAKPAPARTTKTVTAKKDAPKTAGATPVPPAKNAAVDEAQATKRTDGFAPKRTTPAPSPILHEVRATGTFANKAPTTAPRTPSSPHVQTTPHPAQPHPPRASPPPSSLMHPLPSTISLPLTPRPAPSPKHAAPRPPTPAPPRPPRPQRIIEPSPHMPLPDKYKRAGRRVTAIIVSIPIIIVFGWELYGRLYRGKVQKKWGEEGVVGPGK